jgi:hypothetical protein
MTDLLQRLGELDPTQTMGPEALPFDVVDQRRRRRRRDHIRRLAAVGVGLAAISVGLALASFGPHAHVAEALASRTYEAVNPDGKIVYFRLSVDGSTVIERWHDSTYQRTRTTTVTQGHRSVTESEVHGRTVLSRAPDDARVQRATSATAAAVRVTDPFELFRRRYRSGQVRDAGVTTFDGAKVRRLRIVAGPRTITYLVGPASAIPVAIEIHQVPLQVTRMSDGRVSKPRPSGPPTTRIERVTAYQRIPLNATNRRLLHIGPS